MVKRGFRFGGRGRGGRQGGGRGRGGFRQENRDGFRKEGGGFRRGGRGGFRQGGRRDRDSEGFKNSRGGQQNRFRKGGRRDGKPSVDKLDDMLDGYWQKSGNDNQKESMKKMNDEILMNNLDNYWKQKDQPKTNDKEEEKE